MITRPALLSCQISSSIPFSFLYLWFPSAEHTSIFKLSLTSLRLSCFPVCYVFLMSLSVSCMNLQKSSYVSCIFKFLHNYHRLHLIDPWHRSSCGVHVYVGVSNPDQLSTSDLFWRPRLINPSWTQAEFSHQWSCENTVHKRISSLGINLCLGRTRWTGNKTEDAWHKTELKGYDKRGRHNMSVAQRLCRNEMINWLVLWKQECWEMFQNTELKWGCSDAFWSFW